MPRPTLFTTVTLSLLLCLPVLDAAAGNLYRYKNDLGGTVLDDRVPPEFVKNGYEVVSAKGVVIKVVPPQQTEEQKAAVVAELEAQKEAERLREWDESLLRRYSSVEDIEAARDRALSDLLIRVSILKSNKRALKQQIENYQAQAAEAERRGQPVSAEHLQAIKDLQQEIGITDRAIADRDKEIGVVEEAYAADMERFAQLEEMVEFRRQMANRRAGSSDTDPRR